VKQVWRAGDRRNAESSYILIGWLNRSFPSLRQLRQ